MKKQHLLIITLFAALIAVNTVQAIGVSPAQTVLDYQPGVEKKFTIRIINTEGNFVDLGAYKVKDISPYITLEKEELVLEQDEPYKEFFFTIKLPEGLPPGEKVSRVVFEERIPELKIGEKSVSARLKIAHKVITTIPAPDKYLLIGLNSTDRGSSILLEANVKNQGIKDINKLKTTFYIQDGDIPIKEKSADDIELKLKTEAKLKAEVEKDFGDGEYELASEISYDENSITILKNMTIGEPKIELNGIPNVLIAGKINQLSASVRSNWNKKIGGAAISTFILQGGKKFWETRSPAFDIIPKNENQIESYIDARNVSKGGYKMGVEVFYGNSSEKHEYDVSLVSEDDFAKLKAPKEKTGEKTDPAIFIIIIALASLLIAAAVCLKMFLPRR